MILDSITGSPANPSPPLSLVTIVGDTGPVSSSYINEFSAMTVPAFWRAVNFLSDTLASFAISVCQDNGEAKRPVNHPLNRLLTRKISTFSTPFNTLRTFYHHAKVWGNGYLWIKRNPMTAQPVALLNLNPEVIFPFVYEGTVWYFVNFSKPLLLSSEDVLHLPGIGFDGIRGYPVVQMMRQSLSVGKYAESYSAKYFSKGTQVRGAIEVPGNLTDAQLATMRQSLQEYKSVDGENALQTMILQAGAKLNNSTIPNETSQLIETRRWSVIEVCQMLGVPPHVVYELSQGKWNNVQQMGDEVVRYTFSPICVHLEQEFTNKLLSSGEQDAGYYLRIRTDSLLKADRQTLEASVMAQVNAGIITLNEGRAMLELPPVGPEGDKLRVPVSFPTAPNGGQDTTTGVSGDETDPADSEAEPDGDDVATPAPTADQQKPDSSEEQDIAQALPGENVPDPRARPASYSAVLEPLLVDAASRVETKTTKAFENRAGKPDLTIWGNVFAEQQRKYVLEAFQPLANVAQQFGKSIDVEKLADQYAFGIRKRAATGEEITLLDIARGVITYE